jgi:hypothetical protein
MAARRNPRLPALLLAGAVVLAAAGAAVLARTSAPDPRAHDAERVASSVRAPDLVGPADSAARAAPGLRALLGEVIDPAGSPIIGATVTATLIDGDVESRASDGDGAFALEGLAASIARLRFSAPGFADVDVDGARLPAAGEAFWSQKLVPSFTAGHGRVEGVVVDERGRPVPTYRLLARASGGSDVQNGRRAAVTQIDDERGAFSREEMGPTALVVIAAGFRPSDELLVDVRPGHVHKMSIVLERSNALRGRVTDARTGAPLAGTRVALDRVRGVEAAVTGDDGRYVIPSLPGEKVSVLVRAEGYHELVLGGIEGGRSRDEVLDIKLTPVGTGASATEVVGIGVGVRADVAGVLVHAVFAHGPAAGVLQPGDLIIEVDGVSLAGKALREGMSAIRGASGTTIRLLVKNEGGATRSVVLERARVAVPAG